MTYRIELLRPDDVTATVYADDIFDLDVKRPHTAMADFRASIPYSNGQLATENWLTSTVKARIWFADSLLFNGYLEAADGAEGEATTTMEGRGIGRDLKDSEGVITYTAIAVEDAIRDLWSRTNFDATVHPPDVDILVTDKTVQNATTTSEFNAILSLAASTPFVITNDEVRMSQTAFTQEGEDAATTSGTSFFYASRFSGNGPNAGDGATLDFDGSGQSATWTFTPQHDIPGDTFELQIRYEADNAPELDATLQGNTWTVLSGGGTKQDPGWADWGNYPDSADTAPSFGTFEAGKTYTLKLESTTSGGTGASAKIDVVAPLDGRYQHFLDNTLTDGSDGGRYLDGPQFFPSGVRLPFVTENRPENIEAVLLETSWDDTSGAQALEASNDDGADYSLTASNAQTLDQDFPDGDVGTLLKGAAVFDRYGTRDTATPRTGFKSQTLLDWKLSYTGSDLPVIDQQTYRGDLFTIIQKAHRRGDYRFAIDHGALDGNGNPKKVVESFQRGTITKPASFSIQDRNPSIDTKGYANHVTVRGELQADGTRPTATAQDPGEIQALGGGDLGKRHIDIVRPDLSTLGDVKSEARKELGARIQKRSQSGTLNIMPENVLPGYDYEVDWHSNGAVTETTSERVQFSESHQSARGQVQFQRDQTVEMELVEARFQRVTTQDAV